MGGWSSHRTERSRCGRPGATFSRRSRRHGSERSSRMRCVKVLSCAALTAALALAVGCKLLPDNEWPEPYTSIAKEEVRAPIDIQVANARVVEQTLWDYHFEPNSERLNSTGRQRLRWIAPQAQDTYPVIYVAAIDDAE